MLLDLGDPVPNGFERTAIGDIIDKEYSLCATKVRRGDGTEAFLSSCVPNLKLDASTINIDILDLEIDSDSSLWSKREEKIENNV